MEEKDLFNEQEKYVNIYIISMIDILIKKAFF